MSQKSTDDAAGKQSAQPGQASEADQAKRESGESERNSHDHTSREKAGKGEGAGGGAKQKQQH